MTNTIERANTIEQAVEEQKTTSKAEVCFGALMAVAALAGMWGAVSLLISYFVG